MKLKKTEIEKQALDFKKKINLAFANVSKSRQLALNYLTKLGKPTKQDPFIDSRLGRHYYMVMLEKENEFQAIALESIQKMVIFYIVITLRFNLMT